MANHQKIGDYTLLEQQDRTANGTSWRAGKLENKRLTAHYLLDVTADGFASDPAFLEQYQKQSAVASKLEHPNISEHIETIRVNKLASVYGYAPGFSLEKVIQKCVDDGFPFSIDHALLVIRRVLKALEYAKSKKIPHGYVNPALIYLTNEGETKVRGFALAAALRAHRGSPDLGDHLQKYVPPGANFKTGNIEQLDLFACGAILFEMLTGEIFRETAGDVTSIIGNAEIAATGDPIPPGVAGVLLASLDPKYPQSYSEIGEMGKELAKLLTSDYGATTFNLAFFMDSTLRTEVEEMNKAIADEKVRDFSRKPTPDAPPVARVSPRPKGPASGHYQPVAAPAPASSSWQQYFYAALATILVGGFLFYLYTGGRQVSGENKIADQKERLERDNISQYTERLKQQQEEIDKQNDLLKQHYDELAEKERRRKKEELEADMRKMDLELARLQSLKEQEKRQKEIQQQLTALQEQRTAIDEEENKIKRAEERRRQERVDRLKREEENLRLAENQQSRQKQQQEEARTKAAKKRAVQEAAARVETQRLAEEEAARNAEAELAKAEVTIPEPVVTEPPVPEYSGPRPSEGELVDLDDDLLERPVLLESYRSLSVPKKAVSDGVVRKGRTVTFMMRVLINEYGLVENTELYLSPLKGSTTDYGMIEKATKTTKRLKFSKPTKMGIGVKVWIFIPIDFKS